MKEYPLVPAGEWPDISQPPRMEAASQPMMYGVNRARYLEMEIAGRPREWLVPLLYEHLLSHLRRAGTQIANGDIEGRSASLERAIGIIRELAVSLDIVAGGEIADRLSSIYAFLTGELLEIGRTRDETKLRRMIGIVENLHGAWVEAAESVSPRHGVAPAGKV